MNSNFKNSKAYDYLHDLRNLSEGPPDVLDSIRNHKDFIKRPLRMLRKAQNCTDEDVFTKS